MPTSRDELRVKRKQRIVYQFVAGIARDVLSAADQGKTSFHFAEPHYEKAAWSEFLKEILEELQAEFPACDIELDEHLGITVRWD